LMLLQQEGHRVARSAGPTMRQHSSGSASTGA
jgi:hypothetical protein